MRYEVIESKSWRHASGRTASPYGAVPWTSEAERAEWQLVSRGWTVRNPITGEVGIGRAPLPTREAAEALAVKLGKPSAMGMGS